MLIGGYGKREKFSEADAALWVRLVCFITRQSANLLVALHTRLSAVVILW